MLVIEVTLNAYVIAAMIVVSFIGGFLFRRSQIKSLKKKVLELEKEMLSDHADILDLQRHKAILEQSLDASRIPVIPLNLSRDEASDKQNDKARRK